MPRFGVALSVLAVVAGIVWVIVFESLLGAILVVAGLGALGVMLLPAVIDFFVRLLSTGSARRR